MACPTHQPTYISSELSMSYRGRGRPEDSEPGRTAELSYVRYSVQCFWNLICDVA